MKKEEKKRPKTAVNGRKEVLEKLGKTLLKKAEKP